MSTFVERSKSPRNLAQGILAYRLQSMRVAYGMRGNAYIIADKPDQIGTLIGFAGKVFSTAGNVFSIEKYDQITRERELRELVRRLPACMQAFFPDMIYASPAMAYRYCYPRSALVGVSPDALSAAQLAEAVNSLGIDMRKEASLIVKNAESTSHGHDATLNALNVQSKIGALFKQREPLTVVRLKLLYTDAACKGGVDALDARDRIFDRNRRSAEALMKGEIEPAITFNLPHPPSAAVQADVDRYIEEMSEMEAALPICGFVLSVDYSLFSGLYVEATVFLTGYPPVQDAELADRFGVGWLRATENRGFFLNCNAKNHPLSGVFESDDSSKLANLAFDLKCAAMKNQFFFPKEAVGMRDFIVECSVRLQGVSNEA